MPTSDLFTGESRGNSWTGEILQSKFWGDWYLDANTRALPATPLVTTYDIIFDFSIYQSEFGWVGCTYNSQVNWRGLRNNGVKFAIIRVGGPGWTDLGFAKHVEAANAAGILTGFYYWVDPILSPLTNVNGLKAHIERFNPVLAAIDVEQVWGSWNDFDAFLAGRITYDQMLKLTQTQVNNTVRALFDYMSGLQGTKPLIYSGWYYGNPQFGLYPQVGRMIEQYGIDYWNAHYLVKPTPPNHYIALNSVNDLFPLIPAWEKQLGCVSPEKTSLWQISSQIFITGPNPGDKQFDHYDTNVLRPGLDLYNWLGLELPADLPYQIFVPIVSR